MVDRALAAVSWDPWQYRKFATHRLRPARELLQRIRCDDVAAVVDLGCGEGTVTRLLRARWPAAVITGIDSSPEMLAAAKAQDGNVRWVAGDIGRWQPEQRYDVVFSNAALHWLDEHERLLPRLFGAVRPGGVLAVQMPRNFEAPTHRLLAQQMREGPLEASRERLLRTDSVGEPTFYYDLLSPLAAEVDIWETLYLQVLRGRDPVAEWARGTLLRPVLAALQPEQRNGFFAAYAARVREAYPVRPDGATILPFRRLFIVARRTKPNDDKRL